MFDQLSFFRLLSVKSMKFVYETKINLIAQLEESVNMLSCVPMFGSQGNSLSFSLTCLLHLDLFVSFMYWVK